MSKFVFKYFPWLIIIIILSDIIFAWLSDNLAKMITYGSDIALAVFCVVYFFLNKTRLLREYRVMSLLYIFLLIYVVAALVKLQYVTSSMFPFFIMRMLTNFCCFGAVFIFMNESVLNKTMKLWWKYVPVLFVFSFWKLEPFQYIGVLSFVMFLILLRKEFPLFRKMIVVIAFLFIAGWGIIQRMDYIIVVASILLLLMFQFDWILSNREAVKIVYHIQMWLPVFLSLLGLSGIFNVLNFDSYVQEEYKSRIGERFNEDTRTLLYEEAIASAIAHNYVIWGRTPGYGYDSYWVQEQLEHTDEKAALEVSGKIAQRVSEVFIVNMFTWCGIMGIVIFFVFYYKTGLRIINNARNKYLMMFSIYIGFFWMCCFISHQFFAPSSDYILLYIIISICLNPKVQNLSDKKVSTYLSQIFN